MHRSATGEGRRLNEPCSSEDFDAFFRAIEPRLRRALVARLGRDRGREAAAEALAWAWEHRERLSAIANQVAYLYRVGVSRTRLRRYRPLAERASSDDPLFEPELAAGLKGLSSRQRLVVLLVHGAGWRADEVAEMLGVSTSTVKKHLERALHRLRDDLGVERP